MLQTDARSTKILSAEVSARNRRHNQNLITELHLDDLIHLELDLQYHEKVSNEILLVYNCI